MKKKQNLDALNLLDGITILLSIHLVEQENLLKFNFVFKEFN